MKEENIARSICFNSIFVSFLYCPKFVLLFQMRKKNVVICTKVGGDQEEKVCSIIKAHLLLTFNFDKLISNEIEQARNSL